MASSRSFAFNHLSASSAARATCSSTMPLRHPADSLLRHQFGITIKRTGARITRRKPIRQTGLVHAANAHGIPDTALQRLGLQRGASEDEVKKAYRTLALKFHPDVCKGDTCTSNFMQINNAYETIMDCFHGNEQALQVSDGYAGESMMGVYDEDWEEWEEWMGWEGGGTRDYSNHINHHDL